MNDFLLRQEREVVAHILRAAARLIAWHFADETRPFLLRVWVQSASRLDKQHRSYFDNECLLSIETVRTVFFNRAGIRLGILISRTYIRDILGPCLFNYATPHDFLCRR